MNITQQLADALREALDTLDAVRSCAEYEAHSIVDLLDRKPARDALAAYDAQQGAAPGAWNLRMRHIGGAFIYEDDETLVATCDDDKTAARIIQCVNAHDALVSALQAYQLTIAHLQRTTNPGEWEAHGDWNKLYRMATDAARKAGVTA